MRTLLLAEHENKNLNEATRKALTAAKALGAPVHVLVAGQGAQAVAAAAAKLDGSRRSCWRTMPPMAIISPSRWLR